MLCAALLSLLPADPTALPLLFEENRGRYGQGARFAVRARGQTVLLRDDGFDLALLPPPGAPGPAPGAALAIRFEGGRAADVRGESPLPTRVHHLIGSDPDAWSTDNPTFARVRLEEIWPGVDAVFYESRGDVEHDLVVAPGVDPGDIRLSIVGAGGLAIDGAGRLVIGTRLGDVRLSAPVLSQGADRVEGGFRLLGDESFGFEVGAYDPARTLVIDPVLEYATYLGGSGEDWLYDVAVDASGAAYVCGETRSTDLPTQAGVFQDTLPEYRAAYVAKLSPDGSQLDWCTYLGGTDPTFPYGATFGSARGRAIALDAAGNVIVGGETNCADFPTTPGALKTTQAFFDDGFVTKLAPSGDALVWSTLLGGGGGDAVHGLAVDAQDRVLVTGIAQDGFPVPAGSFQPVVGGKDDAFVTALAPNGGLVWSSYYGGSENEMGRDIEVDDLGRVYVAGYSNSGNAATPGGFQPGLLGGSDGFLLRAAADGSSLDYATYIGTGASGEMGAEHSAPGLAVEPTSGRAWYAGWVNAPFAGISPSAFDTSQTFHEGLAALIDTNLSGGASLLHATYVGGSANEELFDAEVDAEGDVWFFGGSTSNDFPTLDPWQACKDVADDAVLLELAKDGTLKSSTFFGGSNQETNLSVGRLAVGPDGSLTFVCRTASTDLGTPGALDTTYGGGSIDGYVARFSPASPPAASATVRVACGGRAPAFSLVAVTAAPALGADFTVAIDDPLGQTGLSPSSTVSYWALSIAPAPGFPCGLGLPGFGVGGGTGELLIGIAPGQLALVVGPQPWGGPGVPSLHTVPVPCTPDAHGVSVFTQGVLTDGTSLVLTDALDLSLGI